MYREGMQSWDVKRVEWLENEPSGKYGGAGSAGYERDNGETAPGLTIQPHISTAAPAVSWFLSLSYTALAEYRIHRHLTPGHHLELSVCPCEGTDSSTLFY